MDIVEVESVTVRKENPYVQDVKDLIKLTKDFTGPEGKVPAGRFTVPNKDAAKTIFYIQQAAIAEGVTARIVSPLRNGVNSKGSAERQPVPEVDAKGKETGNTVLMFKIANKRKENGRKPRTSKGDNTAE